MFPWFRGSCWDEEPLPRKARLQRKLGLLTRWRDELEARLAGLNAAIATVERQLAEEERA